MLHIPLDSICYIIAKAREFQAKEEVVIPETPSSPSEDWAMQVLADHSGDYSVAELVEVCDGFLFTGGRPNVHPEEYGETPTEAHGVFDRARDAITLPLVRALEQGSVEAARLLTLAGNYYREYLSRG